jgi:hypothetical protein
MDRNLARIVNNWPICLFKRLKIITGFEVLEVLHFCEIWKIMLTYWIMKTSSAGSTTAGETVGSHLEGFVCCHL